MKPSFLEFSEAVKGCHILRGDKIIPRYEVYWSQGDDELHAIMIRRSVVHELKDKSDWSNGILLKNPYHK